MHYEFNLVSEFIEFASPFGALIPEAAPEIAGFVTGRYILDLRTEIPGGAPVELQPFAGDPLTFHTEGSRRPLGQQPTLLIFQCVVPPHPGGGGQTLLRSAAQLGAMLSPAARATLARVSYDHDGMPPVFAARAAASSPFATSVASWCRAADLRRPRPRPRPNRSRRR